MCVWMCVCAWMWMCVCEMMILFKKFRLQLKKMATRMIFSHPHTSFLPTQHSLWPIHIRKSMISTSTTAKRQKKMNSDLPKSNQGPSEGCINYNQMLYQLS